MKYFAMLTGAFLLCAASACKKSASVNPVSDDITGSWRWVRSQGGIAGNTLTPATVGYNQTQIYGADSTLKMYKNDTLKMQGRFYIQRNVQYRGEIVDLLKIADQPGRSLVIRNDTLYTYDVMIDDGYGSVYARIR
ncbi:hypothetical protein BDD43_2312 [Mucilaginibacter gracilis]|uniref:Lipocalin-like protein n=1 Tax=Mucilaginibacter gracilis TaxID=423350 RepID=A0A495J048_9SPHI|nr:hypothetical protein [Mucilaginibacter gracilis]RKR82143.1 hypothetical protein BDD43_2312 [Mucilaginibacter gracilis]